MIVEFLCNHCCLYYSGWQPNSLFLSHWWCHSLCTMAFHCLGVKNSCVRLRSCTLSLLIILLIFRKACWAGLLEGPWRPDGFSRGCLLVPLNIFSFTFTLSKTIVTVLSSLFVDIVLVVVYIVHIFILLSFLSY